MLPSLKHSLFCVRSSARHSLLYPFRLQYGHSALLNVGFHTVFVMGPCIQHKNKPKQTKKKQVKAMWPCGKNRAESPALTPALHCAHTHSEQTSAGPCREQGCHFLFPIVCHIECFICGGHLICFDLRLGLCNSASLSLLPVSARCLLPPLHLFLLPPSLVKIRPRGLLASSVCFFFLFLLSNSAGACLSFLIYSFFSTPGKYLV